VDSNWKISDFGIARKMGSESGTLTTSLTGTPIYMPPEVYEAQKDQAAVKVAPAWDMWSLGVMIVQMLTGELPFAGLADILQMKIAINGNLPAPFDVIVQNCLRQDPKQRWTAMQVLEALTPKPVNISPNIIIPQISISTPPSVLSQFRREAVSPNNIALQTFSFETAQITSFDAKNVQIERSQRQSQQFVQDLGNGIKLEMVAIPAGRFLMGAAKNEADASPDEYPQHPVNVPSFFMSKYPITQAQYQIIIGQNPSGFKGANKPVETVSWKDAKAFCQLLNDRTKSKGYRLPSEAEWEYACRAGTNTPFYFGGTIEPNLVNYDGNYPYANAPKGKYRNASTDVASFAANGYGLYDMHGNVWEWCEDVWHENYENAPTDGSTWLTDKNSSNHVLRGGSWSHYALYCRSAYRRSLNGRNSNFGFRVVMSDARGLS
jgi:formylglycine-generating enzyme required for sulfatase activity